MTIKVYNSMSREKEEFLPVRDGEVAMYTCGPTVYDYFHIGNAFAFVVSDTIRRWLEHEGFKVKFIQNFTDVDDKMIDKAQATGSTVSEVASKYIDAYFEDADALGIKRADVHPRATEHIDEMIDLAKALEEKGIAYEVDGDLYFDVHKFEDYGKLSGQPLEELEAGARVRVGDSKRHPADFALWKAYKPGEPAWDSPWGKGRPGWHLECSAMAMKYLGETIDLHCGGADLRFPHHENERAQSTAATGKPFARYWLHNAFLNIEGEKMSKSLGNFFTVRDILKEFPAEVIRFFLLSVHYRSPLNFSRDLVESAAAGLERLENAIFRIRFLLKQRGAESDATASDGGDQSSANVGEACQEALRGFAVAMNDDFNTAAAIGSLFEFTRQINTLIDEESLTADLRLALDVYSETLGVLGVLEGAFRDQGEDITPELQELIEKRQEARAKRDWGEADRIRDLLMDEGIILEDTPGGVRWRRGR